MPKSIYHMPNRVHWATRIWRNTTVWKGRLIRANQYVANQAATHTAPYTSQTRRLKRVLFSTKLLTRVYDEFDHRYYNDGDNAPYRTIPFQEIPGYFFTHDIGDGENDYLGDKIVLDAQFDTRRYDGYHHDLSFSDPTVLVYTRSNSMALGENLTANKVNLTDLNMTARPGRNLFQSFRQTPIKSLAQGEGVGNDEEDYVVSSDDYGPARESIALVVPFLKFRRARVEFYTAQKVMRIRGLTFTMHELPRRTYG